MGERQFVSNFQFRLFARDQRINDWEAPIRFVLCRQQSNNTKTKKEWNKIICKVSAVSRGMWRQFFSFQFAQTDMYRSKSSGYRQYMTKLYGKTLSHTLSKKIVQSTKIDQITIRLLALNVTFLCRRRHVFVGWHLRWICHARKLRFGYSTGSIKSFSLPANVSEQSEKRARTLTEVSFLHILTPQSWRCERMSAISFTWLVRLQHEH